MAEWDTIVSFENLCRAAKRAARGKRQVAGAARYLERLEPNALKLQRSLREGSWRPSRPTTFVITDPKRREISAAPFADRVVHHALIDPLEQRMDQTLCAQTFACRRGKGTHRALNHAQEELRRHSHFLKLDIAKCFASIEHQLVLETLQASVDLESRSMALVRHLLAGDQGAPGVGLPIGNLTSQWFANLVLGRIDRFVLGSIGIGGYVRYMDDFVLFSDSKEELRSAFERVQDFVRTELRLELKKRATILAPASQGLPYLGWRLYRGTRRLRPENARRTRRRLRHRRWELRQGRIDSQQYLAALSSVLAQLGQGTDNKETRSSILGLCMSESEWIRRNKEKPEPG